MNVKVTSRVMNNKLFKLSSEFNKLPYEHLVQRPGSGSGNKYLWWMMHLDCDWVINIDEDLFINNNELIIELLNYMIENDIDFCGPPDGGVPVRFHNPVVMNIFFNIFNVKKIKSKLNNLTREEVFAHRYSEDLEKFTPLFVKERNMEYAYDNFEPYYGIFFWLLRNGLKPMYLDLEYTDFTYKNGKTDKYTTTIHYNSQILAYHTWYARKYSGKEHRLRINNVYNTLKTKYNIISNG